MDHPEGAGLQRADRVDFDPRVRMEFRGTQLSSDGGLLVMRELDDALGLSDLAAKALRDTRRGKNTVHRLDGLLRQSVFGRLAGYEDVNDADRLALDPVMRQVVGGRAVDAQAASTSQMGRFETETLAQPENRNALADLNGYWIDRFHDELSLKVGDGEIGWHIKALFTRRSSRREKDMPHDERYGCRVSRARRIFIRRSDGFVAPRGA
jgi:hypothetical protein